MQLLTLLVPTPAIEFPPKEIKALVDATSIPKQNFLTVISQNIQLYQTKKWKTSSTYNCILHITVLLTSFPF